MNRFARASAIADTAAVQLVTPLSDRLWPLRQLQTTDLVIRVSFFL